MNLEKKTWSDLTAQKSRWTRCLVYHVGALAEHETKERKQPDFNDFSPDLNNRIVRDCYVNFFLFSVIAWFLSFSLSNTDDSLCEWLDIRQEKVNIWWDTKQDLNYVYGTVD